MRIFDVVRVLDIIYRGFNWVSEKVENFTDF